jgi:hypothetical protein
VIVPLMLPVKESAAQALPQPKPKSAARTALHSNLLHRFMSLPPQKVPVILLILAASSSKTSLWLIRSGEELSMAYLQELIANRPARKPGRSRTYSTIPIRKNRNRTVGRLSSKIITKLTKVA